MLQNVSQDRGDSIKAPFYQRAPRCRVPRCVYCVCECVSVCTDRDPWALVLWLFGGGCFEAHTLTTKQVLPGTTEKGQKARRIGTED